jgi:hypothetical protein
MIFLLQWFPTFQIEFQRTPCRGVQRHLALLPAFALAHPNHTRTIVQIDVADVKIRRLAHA